MHRFTSPLHGALGAAGSPTLGHTLAAEARARRHRSDWHECAGVLVMPGAWTGRKAAGPIQRSLGLLCFGEKRRLGSLGFGRGLVAVLQLKRAGMSCDRDSGGASGGLKLWHRLLSHAAGRQGSLRDSRARLSRERRHRLVLHAKLFVRGDGLDGTRAAEVEPDGYSDEDKSDHTAHLKSALPCFSPLRQRWRQHWPWNPCWKMPCRNGKGRSS